MDDQEDTLTYTVVVNHEEQYSIWPVHRPLPLGWTAVSKTGKKVRLLLIRSLDLFVGPLSWGGR